MTSKIFKGFVATAVLCAAFAWPLRADLLELTNGDQYRGKVLSLDTRNVIFQSEIQGRVMLPRSKVAVITLNATNAKPVATAPPVSPQGAPPANFSGTNAAPGSRPAPASQADAVVQELRKEGVDSNLIEQVQQQIFGKSSPEAAQKFDQLMGGLMTGQVSVTDIRKEAQNSINQIKAAKKELGPEAGDTLDSYLSILEKFVQESGSDAAPPPAKPTPGK